MGTDEFVDKSLSCGINPIPGVEFYVRFHGHKIKNVLLSDCVLPPNAKLLLSRYDALTISNLHTEEAQATSRYSATL